MANLPEVLSVPDALAPTPAAPELSAPPRHTGWRVALVVGPLLLALLAAFPALDKPLFHSALGHLLIAGLAALFGAGLALLTLRVAVRAADARVFLVGVGFLSVASIFFIHAVATPDVLLAGRVVAASWSAPISLALGGVFFALSGLPISTRANERIMRGAKLWLALFFVFWLAYSWLVLVTIPSLQTTQATVSHEQHGQSNQYAGQGEPGAIQQNLLLSDDALAALRELITFGGLACYALALWRHLVLFRREPSAAALAIIGGIGLLGEALLTQRFWVLYGTSFWLSHVQEFAGFGAISYAVLSAYRKGDSGESMLESMFLSNTRARIQADFAAALDALADTLARGEQPSADLHSTLQHRLGLSEAQVRVFGQAARAIAQERRQRHELERLNAELRELEAHRDQLTQLVVHDLKNPLTAMIGYLDLLRLGALNADQREYLRRAQLNGNNLAAQINDLLYISQFEEGKLELERALFSPRSLLEECAAQMQAWADQEGQRICVDAPSPSLYFADVRLLRRLVLNLISNAIKHNPSGTAIALHAHCPIEPTAATNGTLPPLVLEVSDTGRGIAADQLDQIFEKYGRASAARPARQTSSGLGLTLCRLVAEAHGGTIAVHSAVGAGSTFSVGLPAIEVPGEDETLPAN